jgi:hypothetical protein
MLFFNKLAEIECPEFFSFTSTFPGLSKCTKRWWYFVKFFNGFKNFSKKVFSSHRISQACLDHLWAVECCVHSYWSVQQW